MAAAMNGDLFETTDDGLAFESVSEKAKTPWRVIVRRVFILVLLLILACFGVVSFICLQIAGKHEARERTLRESAETLESSATLFDRLPRTGNRWMIKAADARRDARMIREAADHEADLRAKYLAAAMRPWKGVPHEEDSK
jgi:hypothetical protein